MPRSSGETPKIAALFERPDLRGVEAGEFSVHANSLPSTPTADAYAVWDRAFRFFDQELFGGVLRDCVITLTRTRALGYFCPGAYQDRDGAVAHEISMNPTWFEAFGDPAALSVFVHEMTHLWRHDHGPLNRKGGKGAGGYHDLPWAEHMERNGLMPSHTGKPGGRRTGFQMAHYIVEGGAFDRACREFLADGNFVDWRDGLVKRSASPIVTGAVQPPAKPPSRARFICPSCSLLVESRKAARLACLDCNTPLEKR